jgi:hypothetical protein
MLRMPTYRGVAICPHLQPQSCMKRNFNNIAFVIHPTLYEDYDVLAIGDCLLLQTLVKKSKHFHLIKKSKFGGIPVVVMDTTDTLKEAMDCLKQYKELYGSNLTKLITKCNA